MFRGTPPREWTIAEIAVIEGQAAYSRPRASGTGKGTLQREGSPGIYSVNKNYGLQKKQTGGNLSVVGTTHSRKEPGDLKGTEIRHRITEFQQRTVEIRKDFKSLDLLQHKERMRG